MKRPWLSLCIVLLLVQQSLIAQEISKDLYHNYPDAVVRKVYELVNNYQLSSEKQLQAAQVFHKEDSSVAKAIMSGENQQAVKRITAWYRLELQKVIAGSEVQEFALDEKRKEAEAEAKLYTRFLQARYGNDTSFLKRMESLYAKKLFLVKHSLLNDPKLKKLDSKEVEAVIKLDSAMDSYKNAADGIYFVADKIKQLDALKPIAGEDKEKIRNGFLNKRRKGSSETMENDFLKVIQPVLKDTVYYGFLYKKEIYAQALEFVLNYPNRRKYPKEVTRDLMRRITPALLDRQRGFRVLDFAMPQNSAEKEEERNKVFQKYQIAIRGEELKYGVGMPQSLFSIAWINRGKLRLNEKQSDSVLAYVQKIIIDSIRITFKPSDSVPDFRTFEKRTLTNLISNTQFAGILAIESYPKAFKWAQQQWGEITAYGIKKDLDSTKALKDITGFQLKKMVSKELFAGNPDKMEADIRQINTKKPTILNALDLVRKNPNSKEALNKSFQW
jgi:hypothetical protein